MEAPAGDPLAEARRLGAVKQGASSFAIVGDEKSSTSWEMDDSMWTSSKLVTPDTNKAASAPSTLQGSGELGGARRRNGTFKKGTLFKKKR